MFRWLWHKLFRSSKNQAVPIDEKKSIEQNIEPIITSSEDIDHNHNTPLTEFDESIKAKFEEFLPNYTEEEYERYKVKRVGREIVFNSIIEQKMLDLPEGSEIRLRKALVESENTDYQELAAIFLLQDFGWEAFDKMRKICEESGIYPYSFRFLTQKPTIPDNIESALLFVRVAQLRTMLKNKIGGKIPTKKDEVYPLFVQHFGLSDMKEILEERLKEVLEQFEGRIKNEKKYLLASWFNHTVENLCDYYTNRIIFDDVDTIKLHIPAYTETSDDLKMLEHLDVTWYDENKKLSALPPFYVGDLIRLDYGYY